LFAEYPAYTPANMKVTKRVKTKAKGKQRELPQLDGLLPMSQRPTASPGPSRAFIQENYQQGPSNVDELVRINMGQMELLKKMGHQVIGPINGPNEGQPQYEVPISWLRHLEKETFLREELAPGPSIPRPYPRPRPLKTMPALQDTTPLIDPALADQAPTPTDKQQETMTPNRTGSPIFQEIVTPDPTNTLEIQSGSGSLPGPNPTVLGKRSTVVRSPQRQAEAHTTQRRKVVTGDDLAAQEAQALLKGVVNKRSRKKKQPGM
jgi:hypothetical protein